MEVAESHCLRTQQMYERDRLMAINYAKDECSKNSRCVGIEYDIQNMNHMICLDFIYTRMDFDKYARMMNDAYVKNHLYKKLEYYGKYKYYVLKPE